jgi:hypothetical protein
VNLTCLVVGNLGPDHKVSASEQTHPEVQLSELQYQSSNLVFTIAVPKHIATTMVTTRLEYCNSLLYKTSKRNLAKLQQVLNTVARPRIVTNSRKRDHITPILMDLHWLPIAARIDNKIAVLTFKSLTMNQPVYLCELLQAQANSDAAVK